MDFLAEQHLAAAKLVRQNGARLIGAERELFIVRNFPRYRARPDLPYWPRITSCNANFDHERTISSLAVR
jgi:hypothetical protein